MNNQGNIDFYNKPTTSITNDHIEVNDLTQSPIRKNTNALKIPSTNKKTKQQKSHQRYNVSNIFLFNSVRYRQVSYKE